jgi:hypothetical protein
MLLRWWEEVEEDREEEWAPQKVDDELSQF